MDTLKRGMKVEICPYRAGGKTARDYAIYDGCSGPVVHLGENGKVRVDIKSSNKYLAGGIDVPVQALKVLKEQEKA